MASATNGYRRLHGLTIEQRNAVELIVLGETDASVGEQVGERIRAHAIANVIAFEKDGKVRVPGVARCIVGTKQDASGARPRDPRR